MADAQYAIDIAAKMTGGRETTAELDALSEGLLGGGKNADFFQEALAKAGKDLDGAKAAADAATAALAEGEAEFKRLERASTQAAKALEKAGQQKTGEVDADLAKNARAAAAALAAQTEKLKGLEAASAAATAKQDGLANTLKNLTTLQGHVSKSLAGQAEGLEKLRGALSASGGALGGLASNALAPVQAFAKLSGEMGATQAAALIATTAIVALTAAMIAGAAAVLTWSVGLSDANRSARLTSEAMEAMHPELVALQGTIAAVSRETGAHADELQELAGKLKAARVSAADLPAALRAAALAEAALGSGGASDFIDEIKSGSAAVSKLSADVATKLGPIVSKQMLGLSAQAQRFKDNLAATFGGLNIDSFLGSLSNIIGDFDQTTVLGRELKATFEVIFQPLLDGAEKGMIALEAFALQLAILGVKAYIALKPFGPEFEALGIAIAAAGVAFAVTFAPAVWAGVVALGSLVATALVAAAPFLAIGAAVALVYEAFTHWDQITAIVSGVFNSVIELGANLIQGLVNGITAGAGAVIGAIGGVVSGAIDHAKALLGIHSPSTVFAGIGDNTIAGYTNAVDDGAPEAQAAVAGAVSPDDALRQAQLSGDLGAIGQLTSPADSPKPAKPAAAAGTSASFEGATFNFYGVEGAEDAEARFKELLTSVFEGDLSQLGGAVAQPGASP